MALLYLKSLFVPNSRPTYTLLPDHHSPATSDSSFDYAHSARTLSNATAESTSDGNEKPVASNDSESQTSRFRIDPRIISDATIGLSDGLTVPFALTAGLSALGDTRMVIYGGLAELVAGAISMGLGGYLGARSEAQAYHAALSSTRKLISDDTSHVADLINTSLQEYHFTTSTVSDITRELLLSPASLETFLMHFHHGLSDESSNASRAYKSALTIAAGYFFGGLLPLSPYFILSTNEKALFWSIGVMAVALFAFGFAKTLLVGEGRKWSCVRSGVEMVLLGGVAAAAAMGCVKSIAGIEP